MSSGSYVVELLDDHHHRPGFSCGVDALDRYFYQQASQDRGRGVAVPYVMTDGPGGAVVGYYALSSAVIFPASLPPSVQKRLPRYDFFPAILIRRLAVAAGLQGRGIGGALLLEALRRCHSGSRQIGAIAVVVDAKDDRARAFYEAFEFQRFADHEYRLYLPMGKMAGLYS